MKEFTIPEMTVIRLSGEDVVTGSICNSFSCKNYYCDICQECTGGHTCFDFTCGLYEKP